VCELPNPPISDFPLFPPPYNDSHFTATIRYKLSTEAPKFRSHRETLGSFRSLSVNWRVACTRRRGGCEETDGNPLK